MFEGSIPDGLGGAESTYFISDGKIYTNMYEDLTGSMCTMPGGDAVVEVYTTGLLENYKNNNILARYGGTMFAWLMVFPSSTVSFDQYTGEDAYSVNLKAWMSEWWRTYDFVASGYVEWYNTLDVYWDQRAMFTFWEKIYDPWTNWDIQNHSALALEAQYNRENPWSATHKIYSSPRRLLSLEWGKMKLARQKNILIQYDKDGRPKISEQSWTAIVTYQVETCIEK
jgi:hypothetical protein